MLNTRIWIGVAALALASACGDDGGSGKADAATNDASVTPEVDAARADGAPPDAAGGDPRLATFTQEAADAICGALYRCCDGQDVADYFAPYRESQLLEAFHPMLPPNADMDEAGCKSTLKQMLDVTPFGDWVKASQAEKVAFDEAAFDTCLASLNTATCGTEATTALFDSECLGFSAPAGGPSQRRFFDRTAGPGTACGPLRDGVGAAFYGTCDPDAAFCCYSDPAAPDLGCTYPFGEGGVPLSGTCQAVSTEDQACSVDAPLQLCKTGLDCAADTGTCNAAETGPLQVGDQCIDDFFNLLGECQNSWCDILGTSLCEPLKADGDDCVAGYECGSGACEGSVCAQSTYCIGDDQPMVDAGVPMIDATPAPDASTVDAAPSGTAETCATAGSLVADSAPSTSGTYANVLAGAFGSSNDYNPLDDSGLEPGCSFVYDALGPEVVYAITMEPGQSLTMRYTVEPDTQPGGIYVLDGCGPVSWPDYEGNGVCGKYGAFGNNEYVSQGFCPVLCDPVTFTFNYPDELNGQPTDTHTFYVVLDQVGSTDGTGFTLEWTLSDP